MTSASTVDAVVRELRFGGRAGALPAADDAGFRFLVDFDSAECWPDVPYDTSLPSARPDEAARSRIVAVLDDAARTMARRAPAARRLVDAQLERVLLRSSDASAGGSASHRSNVGRCLLTNLHQPAAAPLVAIEAVTHESIHQLLYRTEEAAGVFCDLAPTPTFRSPWSGARLPMHSLVHASFVWFGLLSLWSELALAPAADDEGAHARARVAHCLFGFAFLGDLLDSRAFPAASVDPHVVDGIRRMAAAARRATQSAERCATLRQVASARRDDDWPAAVAAGLAREER